MSEGSLEAPIRHPIPWQDPDFTDPEKLDAEMRRVFDICHGCRRCFNLCDSFPRLFDLIDESATGELDSVSSEDFPEVVEACTLCDLCFMTKCPYVPPHEFDLDFPHLMLRYRVAQQQNKQTHKGQETLAKTDRNGALARPAAAIVNTLTSTKNKPARAALEKTLGVDRRAVLPKFHAKTFLVQGAQEPVAVNSQAPAFGHKALLYATCFVNYNNPQLGMATRAVLAHNGVETALAYPRCCGMPQLEQGNIAEVAKAAEKTAVDLEKWIDQGYTILALVPSCALMLKFEWPLIVPDNEKVTKLAAATKDISQYIVELAKTPGLMPGLQPVAGGITLHLACHARAQNMGTKAAELLRLLPDTPIKIIERCSGHGGSWGVMKENFDTAIKVGKPVMRQALQAENALVLSECPLARSHILQGMEMLSAQKPGHSQAVKSPAPSPTHPSSPTHPIEVLAQSYGLLPSC